MSYYGKIVYDGDDNIVIVNEKNEPIAMGAGKVYPKKTYDFWDINIERFCYFEIGSPCSLKKYNFLYHADVKEFVSSKDESKRKRYNEDYREGKKRKEETEYYYDYSKEKDDYLYYKKKFLEAELEINKLKEENQRLISELNKDKITHYLEISKIENRYTQMVEAMSQIKELSKYY